MVQSGGVRWPLLMLCASIVLLLYIKASSAVSLTPDGRHVCRYTCGSRTVQVSYRDTYYVKCGFLWRRRCTKYRTRYRSERRDVSCYKCCDGWKRGVGSTSCLISSYKGCDAVACDSTDLTESCHKCCSSWTGSYCQRDVNECLKNDGGCSDVCVNTPGSYYCKCNAGYELDGSRHTCIDANECLDKNGECSNVCVNTVGSFQCYDLMDPSSDTPGTMCLDVDECLDRNGGCSDTCVNTAGSFQCQCPSDQVLDSTGLNCEDCPVGFEVGESGLYCEDIDECASNQGGCQDTCVNTAGSFQCQCPAGFKRDTSGFHCEDVDECQSDNGGCQQTCVNSEGSFHCDCQQGYYTEDAGHTCFDVDECLNSTSGCSDICVNTEGSYYCDCLPGYKVDSTGFNCECDLCDPAENRCEHGVCVNDEGHGDGYFCICEPKWTGRHCEDVARYNCKHDDPCTSDNLKHYGGQGVVYFAHDDSDRYIECSTAPSTPNNKPCSEQKCKQKQEFDNVLDTCV